MKLRGCLVNVVRAGVLLAALVLAVLVLTPQGRAAAKSAGFLVEVFPSAPIYPLRLATAEPEVAEVRYNVDGVETVADMYRPSGDERRAAMIFYIGVGPERRNPHVVRVSKALARTGLVVLVPVSPELSRFRVTASEPENVVAAFEYLQRQPLVDPERIGMMGISAGGSLMAVAATDPRIRDEVRLIEIFGGYYDSDNVLSALTLRKIQVEGEWRAWTPEPVSVDVFRDMMLETLPPADRKPLVPLFQQTSSTIPQGLSPPARALAELLVNRDPARVEALTAALPPATEALLTNISPESRIGELRTEVFLMHDRDDHIIPFTESRRFRDGAAAAREVHLTELRLFRHVEPSGGGPVALVREGGKLYVHVYSVLRALE